MTVMRAPRHRGRWLARHWSHHWAVRPFTGCVGLLTGLALCLVVTLAHCTAIADPREPPAPTAPRARDTVVVIRVARALADSLAAEWTTRLYQAERGGCLRYERRADGYAVTARERPYEIQYAHANGMSFICSKGAPSWHTHPPQRCNATITYCEPLDSALAAAHCRPSSADSAAFALGSAPFDLVQCGPTTFRVHLRPLRR